MPSALHPMTPPVSIDSIRSFWHSRGFSCDIWTDSPGQVWEDYRHTVDELVMVLEGDVEFEIGGKVFRPAIGEELFIPAGVLHSVRNKARTISRWLYGYSVNKPT
ncbi:cupin domain-containing protein [Petrachloros mirabilis]